MPTTFLLLDRYILRQLVSPLAFSIAVFTLLGELIGITFEQVQFVANSQISIGLSVAVHVLKLPAFLSIGFPLAILLATLMTFSDLTHKGETVALRSIGVSLLRVMLPILLLGLVGSGLAFVFHELVVPSANYKVAMMLEQEWGVDRKELAKYNQKEITYLQRNEGTDERSLAFSFFARRFDGQKMRGVTFLRYKHQSISEIIVSESAQWNEKRQAWEFLSGQEFFIEADGSYSSIRAFKSLLRPLTRDILAYADNTRDHREMNLWALYRRLRVIRNVADARKLRQLNMSIQERYAFPVSVFVFSYLGSCIGSTVGIAGKSNSFGIATLIILGFYAVQFVASYLSVAGLIPVTFGAWLPNVSGLAVGSYALYRR